MLPAGTVRIAVKDSGAGLSPQQLSEICAEGVQFNANELQAGQGSGLGLFISKGIVEQHGGRLVVTSEGLGKGVTFTAELPLFRYNWHNKGYRESLRSLHSKASMDSSSPSENNAVVLFGQTETQVSYGGGGSMRLPTAKRLLVVDDSVFNRKMAARLLEAQDHVCQQAEDGEAAVRKYLEMVERGEPPDAILMDFEMPVMNGPSATARLRELGCACLIVGVTGNVLPHDVAYFLEMGADAVLPKPLVLEDFEQALRRARQPTAAPLRQTVKETPSAQAGTYKVHPFENV
jgi:CheY-like chemotaxis protein